MAGLFLFIFLKETGSVDSGDVDENVGRHNGEMQFSTVMAVTILLGSDPYSQI